jgi:hypothetical protein
MAAGQLQLSVNISANATGVATAARIAADAVKGFADASNRPAGDGLREAEAAANAAAVAAKKLATEQAQAASQQAQAAAQQARAAEQARSAFAALSASLDPAVAVQQRYQQAIGVAADARRQGVVAESQYAQVLAQIEARLSPAALAQQQLAAEQLASTRAAQAEAQQLAALMDALGLTDRAAREYDQALTLLQAGHADGRLSADQYSVAVERLHERLLQARASQSGVASAATAGGGAIQLQAHQWANLSYQLQDVAVQLAGGQNPLLIMMQQGPQATSAVGGVGNALALMRGALMTTAGIAIGATAAIVAAVVAVGLAADHAAGEFRAIGLAQAVAAKPLGETTEALYRQSQAWAEAAGVSEAAGRDMLRAGISAGLTKDTIEQLTLASQDLAAATGTDAVSAFAEFATALEDPARAADELNKRFGLLTAAETAYVRSLASSGQASDAAALVTDKLAGRVKDLHATALSPLQRVWEGIARAASDAGNAMARAALAGFGALPNTTTEAALIAQRDALQKFINNAPDGDYLAGGVAATRAQVAAIDAQLANLRADAQQAQDAADKADAQAKGRQAADLALSLSASVREQQQRAEQIAVLQVGMGDGAGLSAEQYTQAALALDRLTYAQKSYISDSDRTAEAARIEAAAGDKLGLQRDIYVARAQAELEMRGQLLDESERAIRLKAAENQVYAQAAQAQTDRLHAIAAEIDLESRLTKVAGAGAAARRQAEADARVVEVRRTAGEPASKKQQVFEDLKELTAADRVRAEQTAQINQQTAAEQRRVAALLLGASATRVAEQADHARKLALEEAVVGTDHYNEAYQRYVALLAEGDRTLDTSALINLTNQSTHAVSKLRDQLSELERQRPLAQLLDASGELPGALAAVDDQIHQNRLALREAEAAGQGFAGGVGLAAVRLERDLGTAAEQGARVAGAAFGGLEDQIVNLALKGKFSFRAMVDSIKVEMARLAAQKFVVNLSTSVAGSAASSALGGVVERTLDFIGGLFADGGRPPVGKVSVVGERGAELWVPDQPGTVVANDGIAQWLAAQGRNGDSLVAHITGQEAALLKRLGGAGTTNPRTGLLEFYDGGENDRGIGEGGGPSGSRASSDRNDGGDYDRDAPSAGAGRGTLGYSASGATFGYDPNTAVGEAAIKAITDTLERDSFGDALLEALTPVVATTKYDPATGSVATAYEFDIGAAIGGLLGSIFGGPIGGLIGGQLGAGVLGSVPLGSASGVAGARIGAALPGDERESYSDALAAVVQTLAEQTGVATVAIQAQIDLLAKWALQIAQLNPRISEADKIAAEARAAMADLKSGIDEVVKAATEAGGGAMGDAAKAQAVAMVELAAATSAVQQPLSDMASQIAQARAEAAEYAILLKELDGDAAAAQLGLDRTMADLRAAFEGDLHDALLTPAEREFAELRRQQAQRLADARAVGADLALVERVAAVERVAFLEGLADDQRAIFLGLEGAATGLLSSLDAIQAGAATAVDQQLELARTAAQSARQAADAYLDAADRLAKSLADARTGRLSPFSRQQQLTEAQQRFDVAASAAQGGDVAAAQGLSALREALLSSAQAVYGSTGAYAQIFTQSEAAAAQAIAAAAALGTVGSADADVRDQMVAVLESMQAELRGEADAGRLQQQLDALAALDGRLAALHDITLVQTGTLATGLTAAQAATDAVAARLAGGVGIVSAPSIAADLAQVQAALAGNNSVEAGAVRAAIAVLTGTTADGLIDAAEAEPTRAAIAALQTGLAGVINAQTGSLAGTLGLVNNTSTNLLAAINAGTGAAAVNASQITSTLAQVQAALAGNNSVEAGAVRAAIAVLTGTTADGLIDAAEAEPTRAAIAALQTGLAGVINAQTGSLAGTLGLVNNTSTNLQAAINAGIGAATVNTSQITSTLAQVQAALAGNNSAEAGAVRAAIAVLTGTTADGLIDAAEAEPTRAAIAALQTGLAGVINAQTGSLAGTLGLVNNTSTNLLAAINAGIGAATVNTSQITATLAQVQSALAGNNSAEAQAVRAAINVLTGTTADGLIDAAEAEPTRAAIEAMRTNLSALAGATNAAVNASTGQIVRLGDLTASQIAAILSGDTTAANLLGSVSGAVVTQTGEVKAGNTVQRLVSDLTATNVELIRQLTGANTALLGAQNITTDTIRAGNAALTGAIGALIQYQANTAQADAAQAQLLTLIGQRQELETARTQQQPALQLAQAAVNAQTQALAIVQQRDAAVGVAAGELNRTAGATGYNWTTYNPTINAIEGYYGPQSEPDANVTRAALRAYDYARSLGLGDIAGRATIAGRDVGNQAQVSINGQVKSFAEADAAGLTKWVVEQLNAAVGGISADTLAAQNWGATAANMQSTLSALQGQLATQSAADATLAAQIAAATASEQHLRAQIAQLLSVPGYATGTDSSVGGLARLAEDGPELVTQPGFYRLRSGSQVLTASQTRALTARSPAFGAGGGGVDLSPLLAELAALRRDNAEMRGLLARGVQVGERQVEGIGAVARQTAGVASAIARQPLTAARANISYGGRR